MPRRSTPTNIHIDPITGVITYEFRGNVYAQTLFAETLQVADSVVFPNGVSMLSDTTSDPNAIGARRKVQWVRESTGAMIADIFSTEFSTGLGTIHLSAHRAFQGQAPDGVLSAAYGRLQATGFDGSYSAIVDCIASNDGANVTVRAGEKSAVLLGGDGQSDYQKIPSTSYNNATVSTGALGYVDLPGDPTLAVPEDGRYLIRQGCQVSALTNTAYVNIFTSDGPTFLKEGSVSGTSNGVIAQSVVQDLPSGEIVTFRYKVNGGSASFWNRELTLERIA